MSLEPIINLPSLYSNGANVDLVSNTSLNVGPGKVRDSTNTFDIVSPTALTLNAVNVGANGIDTGSLAVNTWYFIYLISDPTNRLPTACLLSTSDTNPIMPSVNGVTYGAFRIVDCWLTNGSSQFIFIHGLSGNSTIVEKEYSTQIRVLNGGTQTGFTNVELSGAIPTDNYGIVTMTYAFTPAAANNTADVNQFFNDGGSPPVLHQNGLVAGVTQWGQFTVIPEISSAVPQISYKVSAGSISLYVAGFQYYT